MTNTLWKVLFFNFWQKKKKTNVLGSQIGEIKKIKKKERKDLDVVTP